MYVIDVIRQSFRILASRGRNQFIFLQLFNLLSAFIQVFGVASIAPFIAVISNPEIIHTNAILARVYSTLNLGSDSQFITLFALLTVSLIAASNLITGLTQWLSLRFSVDMGSLLQNELFSNLLRRPYIFHKVTDHSAAISLVNSQLPRFIYMVLQPILILFSQLMVTVVILIGLFVLDPLIAASAGLIVGGSYALTYFFIRNSLAHHGRIVSKKNRGVQAILSEAFMGVKEIKLRGNEQDYVQRFEFFNHQGLVSSSFISLAGDLPKLVIETISFGAIILLAVLVLSFGEGDSEVIGLISLYALAGYKLLPTMQQIYRSIASISAHGSIVPKLAHNLAQTAEPPPDQAPAKSLAGIDAIGLEAVSFCYPGAANPALQRVSLAFTRGTVNTIAGPSGSGKSTLADIALGLLQPQSGHLTINGKALAEDQLRAYRAAIGYVPQHIFLTNDSVVANIAFGVPSDEIDLARVERALAMAKARDFVDKLPNGMHSNLGQDGKLLSGGQRQRIGIARALYHDAQVLILDEPTSALDIESEHEVMLTLQSLKNAVLIVIISHRPAAIKMSDNITLIENGELVARGSYIELQSDNTYFQKLMEMSAAEDIAASQRLVAVGAAR